MFESRWVRQLLHQFLNFLRKQNQSGRPKTHKNSKHLICLYEIDVNDPKIEIALAAKLNLDIIPFNVTPLKLSKRCRILTSCFNHTSSHDHFFESLIIAFDCGADQPVDCSCVEIDSSESPSSKAPFAQSTAAALSAISSLENSLFLPLSPF